MATTPVSSSTNSASGFGLLSGNEATMGRDDFLKLLVEQIKNQDPLAPKDNSEFVAQLAQFSSLEQSMAMNDRLDTLTLLERGASNTQVLSMVGQKATVKGNVVTTDGNGGATGVSFTLGGNSAKTTVTISDSSGNTVRSIDVGAKNQGVVNLYWDGKSAAGNLQPKGSYKLAVTATNSVGASVPVDMQTVGIIDAISFDEGYPIMHLNNGATAPVSDLLRVENPPSGS